MEEESWRRNHGGGIMEEESWRRKHGRGIMEDESWRRNHGGGIMEEESWKRNHGLGGTQEAPRRHPEAPRRHPEAPRRHLGGTQKHPGGTQEARGILEAKCVKTCVFFSAKVARATISCERGEGDPHRLRCLCTKVGRHSAADLVRSHRDLTLDRENPYSRELFGEKSRFLHPRLMYKPAILTNHRVFSTIFTKNV